MTLREQIHGARLKPGSTLPNGATLVASSEPDHSGSCIVLAITQDGEYVTWFYRCGETIWGEYCRGNFRAALASFDKRAGVRS